LPSGIRRILAVIIIVFERRYILSLALIVLEVPIVLLTGVVEILAFFDLIVVVLVLPRRIVSLFLVAGRGTFTY
jgi:hypothetical protein